jgi:hypothetical protein
VAGFLFGVLWEVISWNSFAIPRAIIGAVTGSAGN